MTVEAVLSVIWSRSWSAPDEDALQDALAGALAESGVEAEREVRIGGGRIDLLAGRVGIEVKVAGSPASVVSQLTRYCQGGDVDHVILVTTRSSHCGLEGMVGDVPVTVCWVGLGAL